MSRSKVLTPEARQFIEDQIHDHGEITTDEVMELVRPHFIFDPESAREQQIRRTAHRIMSSIRDTDKTRICFAIKRQGESTYVNVESNESIEDLNKVRAQLGYKFDGLTRSLKKVNERTRQIQGQLTFDERTSKEA